jgi:hypothetical protein
MASTSTQTVELPEREPEQVEKTAPVPETKPSNFVIKVSSTVPV